MRTAWAVAARRTDLWTVRAGIPLLVVLVGLIAFTDIRRDRGRPPGRLLTAASVALAALFVALVAYRFGALTV